MSDSLVSRIVSKYLSDRELIKEMKRRHADELRVLEEFQAKREQSLLEKASISEFSFFVDLYINGRDGKAEKKKEEADIGLNQVKIESWLLKMLSSVGDGIKTVHGTVYRTRKEGVTVADFDMFVDTAMLREAAESVIRYFEVGADESICQQVISIIHENMHLELLNKAVNKTAILELMGEPSKDGSRPNSPPAGVNYVAIQSVGVRKK